MSEANCARLPGFELSRRETIAGGVAVALGVGAATPIPLRDPGFVVVGGWVLTREDLERLGRSGTA